MTGSYRTVVRRFLDLFDRAGPIFESADIIDLVVTHILEDLPGERRTTAGSAIEDNGLFLIEILVVVWRVRVGAKSNIPRETFTAPAILPLALTSGALVIVSRWDDVSTFAWA